MKQKLLFILIFLLTSNVLADYKSNFQDGLRAYQKQKYLTAENYFELVLRAAPNDLTSSSTLLLAQTLYQQKKYSKTKELCKSFQNDFPESRYKDDVKLLLAKTNYNLENYNASVSNLLEILSESSEQPKINEAKDLISKISVSNLAEHSLRKMISQQNKSSLKIFLNFQLIRKIAASGRTQEAEAELTKIFSSLPDEYFNEVKELQSYISNSESKPIQIGVILPLSGIDGEMGNRILDGIKFSFNEFIKKSPLNVALRIEDTASEFVNVVKISKKFALSTDVICAIGPIRTEEFTAAAAIAAEYDFPIISPTATGSGITTLGETIFQANTDLKNRGSIAADYLVETLHCTTFAILAPLDNYGTKIVEGFSEKLNESKSKILAEEWYTPGTTDFTQQFNRIRNVGFGLLLSDTLQVIKDSLGIEIKDGGGEAANFNEKLLKQEILERWLKITKGDLLKIPVKKIDAIFMPCYSDELSFVLAQFAFQNIRCKVVGAESWYDERILNENKIYTEEVIFFSEYFWDTNDFFTDKFINQFRVSMKTTPDKLSFYGYDTAKLVLETLEGVQSGRKGFVEALQNVRDFKGKQHHFNFKNNVNDYLHVLKFQHGEIVKIND